MRGVRVKRSFRATGTETPRFPWKEGVSGRSSPGATVAAAPGIGVMLLISSSSVLNPP